MPQMDVYPLLMEIGAFGCGFLRRLFAAADAFDLPDTFDFGQQVSDRLQTNRAPIPDTTGVYRRALHFRTLLLCPRRWLVRLVPNHDCLRDDTDHVQIQFAGDHIVKPPVPIRLVRPEIPAEDRPGHRAIEREDLRPAANADVVAAPRRRVPVYDPQGAAGFAFQVRWERRTADDPDGLTVPMEPDGRFARAMLAVMGEMGVQWTGQKLIEVEDRAVPSRNLSLDDPHLGSSQSSVCRQLSGSHERIIRVERSCRPGNRSLPDRRCVGPAIR